MRNKGLLSAFVVITFVVYAIHQRHEGSVVVAPNSSGGSSGTPTTTMPSTTPNTTKSYKDGEYTGASADAVYGTIQVKATIQGGRITDVQFLQYPNDRSQSIRINQQAMPLLKQEAIQAQSAQVDGVSGATDTSQAFEESLSSALNQAT